MSVSSAVDAYPDEKDPSPVKPVHVLLPASIVPDLLPKRVTMASVPLIVVASAGSLLNLPILGWFVRKRHAGPSSLVFWLIVTNGTAALNSIIWANDVDVRFSGGCLLMSKLRLGGTIAIPLSFLCTGRLLIKILGRKAETCNNPSTRLAEAISGCLCLLVPALVMGLHSIYAPTNYSISLSTGCEPTFFLSLPTYLLLFIWQQALGVAAFVVGCFCLWTTWTRHTQRTLTSLLATSPLTWVSASRIWRLSVLAATFGLLNVIILGIYFGGLSGRSGGYMDWNSQITAGASARIWQYPSKSGPSSAEWLAPITGLLMFLLTIPECGNFFSESCQSRQRKDLVNQLNGQGMKDQDAHWNAPQYMINGINRSRSNSNQTSNSKASFESVQDGLNPFLNPFLPSSAASRERVRSLSNPLPAGLDYRSGASLTEGALGSISGRQGRSNSESQSGKGSLRSHRSEKSGKSGKSSNSNGSKKSERSHRSEKSDKSHRSEKSDRSHRSEKSGKSDRSGKSSKSSKSHRTAAEREERGTRERSGSGSTPRARSNSAESVQATGYLQSSAPTGYLNTEISRQTIPGIDITRASPYNDSLANAIEINSSAFDIQSSTPPNTLSARRAGQTVQRKLSQLGMTRSAWNSNAPSRSKILSPVHESDSDAAFNRSADGLTNDSSCGPGTFFETDTGFSMPLNDTSSVGGSRARSNTSSSARKLGKKGYEPPIESFHLVRAPQQQQQGDGTSSIGTENSGQKTSSRGSIIQRQYGALAAAPW